MAKFNWDRAKQRERNARQDFNYKPKKTLSLSKATSIKIEAKPKTIKSTTDKVLNIREEINNINLLFFQEISDTKISNVVEPIIGQLRSKWKANKDVFSKEDIQDLKSISDKLAVVKQVAFLICHPEKIRDNSYPLGPKSELRKLVDKIKGMAIESKFNSQIKNIIDLKCKESYKVIRKVSVTRQDIIFNLKLEAPLCPKCNIKMVLKEADNTFFYGCDNFPDCRQRKWISRRINEQLNRLDPRNQY